MFHCNVSCYLTLSEKQKNSKNIVHCIFHFWECLWILSNYYDIFACSPFSHFTFTLHLTAFAFLKIRHITVIFFFLRSARPSPDGPTYVDHKERWPLPITLDTVVSLVSEEIKRTLNRPLTVYVSSKVKNSVEACVISLYYYCSKKSSHLFQSLSVSEIFDKIALWNLWKNSYLGQCSTDTLGRLHRSAITSTASPCKF